MIRVHVNAVLAVRNGFTGRAVSGGALQCFVDGIRYHPVEKAGGYLVFSNLPDGTREICLTGSAFQEERIWLEASRQDRTEMVVTLKPSSRYPFGGSVTTLDLKLEGEAIGGQRVWLAGETSRYELKIAQDKAGAGETAMKLYYRCQPEELSLPRTLLLLDDEATEACALWEIDRETGTLAEPLRFDHKRGCSLFPAQCSVSDASGAIRAVFREPIKLSVYCEAAGLNRFPLQEGENKYTIQLEGR